MGPAGRRAVKPGELVDVEELVSVAARPQFVSRGGIKLANALASTGLEVAGQARAGRGRLDGRVHRLPAAARRAGGDRRGRRLRDARLEPAHGSPRARDGANERADAVAADAARRALRRPAARPIWRRSTCRSSRWRRCWAPCSSCLAPALRRAGSRQAPVRGRPRAGRQRGGGARGRGAPRGAGRRRARRPLGAGRGGARISLLGAARAEGQPRDVHLARPRARIAGGERPRSWPASAPSASSEELERMAREVEP